MVHQEREHGSDLMFHLHSYKALTLLQTSTNPIPIHYMVSRRWRKGCGHGTSRPQFVGMVRVPNT